MTISINQSPDLVGEITSLLNAMREALEAKTQSEAEATREGVADIKSDVAHVQEATQAARTDIATVKSDVDDLTTVNGQISTEVQAINTHTSTELETVKTFLTGDAVASENRLKAHINAKSAIRNIYRVSSNGQRTFKIPAVNTEKTVVNVTSQTTGTAYCYAYLQSSTQLVTRMHGASTPINVEIIEYA